MTFHRFWYVYQRRNHARNLGREVSNVMGVPQSWSKSLGYDFSYWNNDADDQGSHDWRKPSESHDMPMKSPLIGGWPTPLKNMLVSWDDDIPNIWEKMFQTTNQYNMLQFSLSQVVQFPNQPMSLNSSLLHRPPSFGLAFPNVKARSTGDPPVVASKHATCWTKSSM